MEKKIDLEKTYSKTEVIKKLRRLVDALEAGKTFEIQISGKRVYVPPTAVIEFEYEKNIDGEEIEIEIKWS